jgi:hypothetical protein
MNDGTIVIENPNDPDGGTVFKPLKQGFREYIDNLLQEEKGEMLKIEEKKNITIRQDTIMQADYLSNNDVNMIGMSLTVLMGPYEWEPGDTGYSWQKVRDLKARLYAYHREGKTYVLSYEDLYALSHAHDLAIEKAGVEEYHTLTGHDFSEALALQKKLHAQLQAMDKEED